MLRIFELNSKEFDDTVFTVDVGGDKCGITRQELIEMVEAKHAKAQARRGSQRKISAVQEGSPLQVHHEPSRFNE